MSLLINTAVDFHLLMQLLYTDHTIVRSYQYYNYVMCNWYDFTFTSRNSSGLLQLTPSQDKEEPPLFGELAENSHQHEVEHDTLTQHPAEGSQKQVVQQSCHKCTASLMI